MIINSEHYKQSSESFKHGSVFPPMSETCEEQDPQQPMTPPAGKAGCHLENPSHSGVLTGRGGLNHLENTSEREEWCQRLPLNLSHTLTQLRNSNQSTISHTPCFSMKLIGHDEGLCVLLRHFNTNYSSILFRQPLVGFDIMLLYS